MRPLFLSGLIACFGAAIPAIVQTPAAETYVNSAESRVLKGDVDGALKDLTQAIALDPKNAHVYRYRGSLRSQKGDHAQAIADFTQAIALDPKNARNYVWRSSARRHTGDSDGAIADAQQAVALDPKLELAHETLFATYLDRAYRDTSLTPAQKGEFVARGLEATNVALRRTPSSIEATSYKAMFLWQQARLETDDRKKSALMKEVYDLEDHLQQLLQQPRTDPPAFPKASFLDAPPQPPIPPPPPPQRPPAARAPIRISGDIQPPKKTKDVPPVYPPIAIRSRIQGQVIIEATIDERGRVAEAKVVKSVPQLDKAAVDAVRQWEYTTTKVNGVPVAVIMTVTVTFNLK